MFDLLATILSWFYDLVPNYAVAIVLLTMAILLAVTPLTLKGTRSMLELQIHQPELKRIQTQYRDDRQRMNEELMKFYSEHKINPVGGCLPLLIQLPVFFILYNVIRGLNHRTDLLSALLQGDPNLAGAFDPKHLDTGSALYNSLHGVREMTSFGIDFSLSFFQAVGQSFTKGLPYLLLILGATATSYYQQKQIQGRSTTQINPQMQMLTRIMPLFITVISLTLPAALTLYFLASGLYRIGQQAIITRHIYGPHSERLAAAQASSAVVDTKGKEAKGTAASAPPAGGFLGKLLGGPAGPASNGDGSDAKAGSSNGSNGKGSGTSGPRPTGRVTPPGGPGNRPASSKKKKRK